MKYINSKDTAVQALASEYKAPQILYIEDVDQSVESGLGFDVDDTLLLSQSGTTYTFTKKPDYLTFTSTGNSVINMSATGSRPNVQYKINNGSWITWNSFATGRIELSDGDVVVMKGNNPNGFSTGQANYTTFYSSGSIAASGNIMSLIDGVGETLVIPSNYCFYRLFYNSTALTSTPKLPATTLTNFCYDEMFNGCISLVTAPSILPATTLKQGCYGGMFQGCSSLVNAPELPATTLEQSCYNRLFCNCSQLNYVKCLAINISAFISLTLWMENVSATGTFVKAASMNAWPRSTAGIPSGWTVVNA